MPTFPDARGWLGGDAAYSVALPAASKTLWLFGDSFVDPRGVTEKRRYPFVHNSIGLSSCSEDGTWSLNTYWDKGEGALPLAFFAPDPNADWARETVERSGHAPYYWPFDGFVVDGTLYVGLLRISHSEPRGPFRLPFRVIGMDLARIDNPLDSPNIWNISISTLSKSQFAFPGAAYVVEGDFVYAFSFYDRPGGEAPRAVARLPISVLQSFPPNLSTQFETYDDGGNWIKGFTPERASILMSDSATEMSVHFDTAIGRWIAVYGTPNPPVNIAEASIVWIRSAERLEGPWSRPHRLFAIPETIPRPQQSVDPNLFCYAAKAHPEFSKPGNLLVTYVCSLFAQSEDEIPAVLERLLKSPELYRPRAVSIAIPSELATAPPELLSR
jgi:hypothetical protein